MPQVIDVYELHPLGTLRNEARNFADAYDRNIEDTETVSNSLGSLRDALLAYYEHLERVSAQKRSEVVAVTFDPSEDGV